MVSSEGAHSEVGWEEGLVPSGLRRERLQGTGTRAVPTQRLQEEVYREERMQKEEVVGAARGWEAGGRNRGGYRRERLEGGRGFRGRSCLEGRWRQ